ncbi:hypothetical protein [Chenggangzhangella methanolivorans]|nr:hypothetical protein [Chenggangzhangella methanolivorans]
MLIYASDGPDGAPWALVVAPDGAELPADTFLGAHGEEAWVD